MTQRKPPSEPRANTVIDRADTFEELLLELQDTVLGAECSIRELAARVGLNIAEDFRGVNLQGIDLRNQNLAEFDFSYSDLSGADLRGTWLRPEQLVGAKLDDALLDQPFSGSLAASGNRRNPILPGVLLRREDRALTDAHLYQTVKDDLPWLVRGAEDSSGRPNEQLLAELPAVFNTSLCFAPGLSAIDRIKGELLAVSVRVDPFGIEPTKRRLALGSRALSNIARGDVPVSLASLARLHLACKFIASDSNRSNSSGPVADIVRSSIGPNGLRRNSIEISLYVLNAQKLLKFRQLLISSGATGLNDMHEFSRAILQEVPMDRSAKNELLRSLVYGYELGRRRKTHRIYRISPDTVNAIVVGCTQLARKFGVSPPEQTDLFTFGSQTGSAIGRGTIALSPKSGNLVGGISKV